MEVIQQCPECGTVWDNGKTCEEHFHQMLFWEAENPANGEVHHLMVLCYHIQHPSLYSPDGLRESHHLLAQFLEQGLTPQAARQLNRTRLDSDRREFKITGTRASHGAYPHPVQWMMTAASVTAAGEGRYRSSVRAWAKSVYQTLKSSNNFLAKEV